MLLAAYVSRRSVRSVPLPTWLRLRLRAAPWLAQPCVVRRQVISSPTTAHREPGACIQWAYRVKEDYQPERVLTGSACLRQDGEPGQRKPTPADAASPAGGAFSSRLSPGSQGITGLCASPGKGRDAADRIGGRVAEQHEADAVCLAPAFLPHDPPHGWRTGFRHCSSDRDRPGDSSSMRREPCALRFSARFEGIAPSGRRGAGPLPLQRPLRAAGIAFGIAEGGVGDTRDRPCGENPDCKLTQSPC